jgi:rhamnosyltransferase subunit B
MLGLALALRSRGHDVTVATSPYYAHMAREHGIPFEPLGTEEQFRAAMQHPDVWHPRRSFAHLFRTMELAREQQYQLFARFHREGPFAGVANCICFGAHSASEQFGFPLITSHIQPAVLWSDIKPPKLPGLFGSRWLKKTLVRIGEKLYVDPVALPTLNQWRAQLNLPPIQRLTSWWHSKDGVLCLFPEWFAAPQPDWPRPLEQTDFPLWNFQSQRNMPEEVTRFLEQGDSPIAFTPGSANMQARAFFATAVETCKRLGRRGILLTEFEEHLPTNMPPTVGRFSYVPLDLLLPRCCAIVHHGGMGTASQGMLAGIPQLIMPMAYDQFDNAERLRELGIGLAVPVRSFRAPRVAHALHALLTNSSTSKNCRTIAQRLANSDGLTQSAMAVERLIARAFESRPTKSTEQSMRLTAER